MQRGGGRGGSPAVNVRYHQYHIELHHFWILLGSNLGFVFGSI
jgi:hypothetical protein